jgi:hypothetical protein
MISLGIVFIRIDLLLPDERLLDIFPRVRRMGNDQLAIVKVELRRLAVRKIRQARIIVIRMNLGMSELRLAPVHTEVV